MLSFSLRSWSESHGSSAVLAECRRSLLPPTRPTPPSPGGGGLHPCLLSCHPPSASTVPLVVFRLPSSLNLFSPLLFTCAINSSACLLLFLHDAWISPDVFPRDGRQVWAAAAAAIHYSPLGEAEPGRPRASYTLTHPENHGGGTAAMLKKKDNNKKEKEKSLVWHYNIKMLQKSDIFTLWCFIVKNGHVKVLNYCITLWNIIYFQSSQFTPIPWERLSLADPKHPTPLLIQKTTEERWCNAKKKEKKMERKGLTITWAHFHVVKIRLRLVTTQRHTPLVTRKMIEVPYKKEKKKENRKGSHVISWTKL